MHHLTDDVIRELNFLLVRATLYPTSRTTGPEIARIESKIGLILEESGYIPKIFLSLAAKGAPLSKDYQQMARAMRQAKGDDEARNELVNDVIVRLMSLIRAGQVIRLTRAYLWKCIAGMVAPTKAPSIYSLSEPEDEYGTGDPTFDKSILRRSTLSSGELEAMLSELRESRSERDRQILDLILEHGTDRNQVHILKILKDLRGDSSPYRNEDINRVKEQLRVLLKPTEDRPGLTPDQRRKAAEYWDRCTERTRPIVDEYLGVSPPPGDQEIQRTLNGRWPEPTPRYPIAEVRRVIRELRDQLGLKTAGKKRPRRDRDRGAVPPATTPRSDHRELLWALCEGDDLAQFRRPILDQGRGWGEGRFRLAQSELIEAHFVLASQAKARLERERSYWALDRISPAELAETMAKIEPPWDDDRRKLAGRLLERAKGRTPFEDLPSELGLSLEAVSGLIDGLRGARVDQDQARRFYNRLVKPYEAERMHQALDAGRPGWRTDSDCATFREILLHAAACTKYGRLADALGLDEKAPGLRLLEMKSIHEGHHRRRPGRGPAR